MFKKYTQFVNLMKPNRLTFRQDIPARAPGRAEALEVKTEGEPSGVTAKGQREAEGRKELGQVKVEAGTKLGLKDVRAEIGPPKAPGTPSKAPEKPPVKAPDQATSGAQGEKLADAKPAGTEAKPKEPEKKDEEEVPEGPLGGLYKLFQRIGEKLAKLFENFMLIGSASDAKKLLNKIDKTKHAGYDNMTDFNALRKNLETGTLGQEVSSTVEYISKMLGIGAVTDAQDLYLGLKNTKNQEGKDKYAFSRSSNQLYPKGTVLFFSAKLTGEKTDEKTDTRHFSGYDSGKITHAAVVTESGTLSTLKLRFVSKDGDPKTDSNELLDRSFGTAGTPFGHENFVGALYSPQDLSTEETERKAEEEKPSEGTPETAVADTGAAKPTAAPAKPVAGISPENEPAA